MPNGNRRGPLGEGPRTGRGLGLCNGNSQPGSSNTPGMGKGQGCRRGGGRGWRNWFRATGKTFQQRNATPVTEPKTEELSMKSQLQNRMDVLQKELEVVRKQIERIEK